MPDLLEEIRFQGSSCDWTIHQDAGLTAKAILITFLILATLIVSARLASRRSRWGGAGYRWDDGVAALIFIPIVGAFACGFGMIQNGLGRDVWTLTTPEVLRWSLWFFAEQPLWVFSAYFTKLSLLLLYLRIWKEDSSTRNLRLLCKGIAWFLSIAACAMTMATILGCTPISAAWRLTNVAKGACVNRPLLAYFAGALNAILDIVIIILPIPKVLALRVTMQQKLGLVSCFLVGFVVTAAAVVRLTQVHKLRKLTNITYDFVDFVYWCGIELSLSMICCCMPAMAGLLKRCSKWVSGTSSQGLSKGDLDLVFPEKTYDSHYSDVSSDPASPAPVAARGYA
ncbi:unnamed protein product [Zymoseptoria tritici ST99CH_3D7]|uniref:Rhodopsin domain-containing protein n=1 Tax=Zymoseptoria tritici (strain ST99CH_3D7) TaxID=1276538 RepID=A0A1X7RN06_ZYMT9|nr:unnamed protein product [Zymoseptoria tritici ST99CH_3D7]